MRCLVQSLFVTLLASTSILAGGTPSWAQTETETATPTGSAEKVTGILTEATDEQPQPSAPALDGYCPVCIGQLNEWVKGSPAYQTTYDGRLYFFPGEKYKNLFLADPTRFAPVLGGDCVVSFAKTGRRMPGSVRHSVTHRGRLFMFANDEAREMFSANPDAYSDLDLALRGDCPVSRVELNTRTPGRPELVSRRNGFRYYFSSHELREKFLADPEKYAMRAVEEGLHE
ncbi:MAG: hypothetical protein V3R99_03365 [Thermoguttaceae bacterium]